MRRTTDFLFIYDIFRRDTTAPAPFDLTCRWKSVIKTLYHLCRVPLQKLTDARVDLLSSKVADAAVDALYATMPNAVSSNLGKTWAELYWKSPDDNAIGLVQGLFAKSTVVGYDLSPFCRKALHAAGIPWISICVHPIRFLDDLVFAWESNIPAVAEFLHTKSIDFDQIDFVVAQLQAKYAINYDSPLYRFPEKALIILPQEQGDPLPISKSGKLMSFSDYAQDLLTLASHHSKTFLYTGGSVTPHWVPLSAADKLFITNELHAITLPNFSYQLYTLYMAMAAPYTPTFAGLSSKSLYEARLFSAPSHSFAPEAITYGQKETTPADAAVEHAWALDTTCFTLPFWSELLDCFQPARTALHVSQAQMPAINARMLFRNGGSDFDDAASFSQCLRTAKNDAALTAQAQNQKYASIIECYSKHDNSSPDAMLQGTQKYAIFSTGCQKLVGPYIAAVESLRKYSGNADAFYITQCALMPDEKRELLHEYNIQLIDTTVDESLQAPYPVGTAHAYLYLKGPEILQAMGYAFSISVHADVLCLRKFNVQEIFSRTSYLSSCNGWPHPAMTITERAHIDALTATRLPWWDKNMNPGIIFNNNTGLQEFGLWDKAMKLYSIAGPDAMPLNEESLYSLLVMLNPKINRHEESVQFMMVHDKGSPPIFPHFVHFSGRIKPWHFTGDGVEFAEKRHKLWHVVAKDVLGEAAYKRLFTL